MRRCLGLLLAALLCAPVAAEPPRPLGWAFPPAFLDAGAATPASRQRILDREEAVSGICAAHRGTVPLILGALRLDVGCNVFVHAGTVERFVRPTAADAPFTAFRVAMTLEREPPALLIWEPLEGPAPFVGDWIWPVDCRPLFSAYERCGVSADAPHAGDWDFYIRREPLPIDRSIHPYNENVLKCRAVEADLHCEFFDNAAEIVEVRVRFVADGSSDDSALIGHFRNLQQTARLQTWHRLARFGGS